MGLKAKSNLIVRPSRSTISQVERPVYTIRLSLVEDMVEEMIASRSSTSKLSMREERRYECERGPKSTCRVYIG